jgi:hypothetical protein
MTADRMGDDVYQPTGTNEEQEDAAPLDMQDAVGERTYDDALDERLAQEVPDVTPAPGDGIGDAPDTDGEPVDPEAGDARSGRLVAPDQGAHTDTTKELVAEDEGIDGGAAGAEEAAMHTIDDDTALPENRQDRQG